MRWLIAWISLFCCLPQSCWADEGAPLLLQKPSVSASHVAFGFAGDLWVVSRQGGDARRLTSGVGLEFGPHFSPDGSHIAFTGEYDGNIDVYVIPTKGGEPKRLTYHPGVDVALGWTADGKNILFSSGRTSYSRFNKLFTLSADGQGMPSELPLPMGEQGAISPDGERIAYVPFWNRRSVPNNYIAWKRYRGGLASPIWVANLSDSRVVKIPRKDSNDFNPMWLNGKVYFLSDRNGPVTLFAYDPSSGQVAQVLENTGFDLISAGAGKDVIVYEQFGSLHLFDPKTSRSTPIKVAVAADYTTTRPRFEKVSKRIGGADLSPSGARAVFEARGEIITVPAEKGDSRNLTQTPGVMERSPVWSPDGKWIAYLSDESGEYMLHLRDARGGPETKKLALGDAPNFYFNLVWSPDSQKIAYADNRLTLWYIDLESSKNVRVDAHTHFSGPSFDPAWSPDSRWLGYVKDMPNHLRAAFLHELATGQNTQITDGMSDARHLVFDRSGKYLFFTASTDIGPTTSMIDMSGMNRQVTRSIYLVVLSKDVPSPLAPESDEEKEKGSEGKDKPAPESTKPVKATEETAKADDEKPDQAKKDEKADKTKAKPPEKLTKIDLEGIGQRILALPLPAKNYLNLQGGKAGVLFIVEMPTSMTGMMGPGGMGGVNVQKYDLNTRKTDSVVSGVRSFTVSANGDKMLYRQGDKWVIAPAAGGGAGAGMGRAPGGASSDNALKIDDLEVRVEPRAEWRQMYREAWRLQRDFVYDPNYHGLDLQKAEKTYAVFLDGLTHRSDLNYLFNEMLGQLTLGHTYVAGGDAPEVKRVKGGLLGADWKIENGRYRFAAIFNGENWNPQLKAPLTQPGVNVKEGEYLLAIDGQEITDADNLYARFEATAGKALTLKVGPNPNGDGAREVTVVPIESEMALRNLAWIESNRRKVDQLSGGQVAYVYLPDTGFGGYANFNRYFFAQTDKQGVILDERFNGGGKAADYIIDYLRREPLNYWTTRHGKDYVTPGGAIYGPKVMIINEFAGSGGDAMPWYFRKAKIGPLVGKRTWGGLVGISGYPPLMDGGMVTAPSFAFYSPDGTWDVENHGVAPDIEVDLDPYLVRQGIDPQLEKAVQIVMEELKKNPQKEPKRPKYPNYHKKQ